MLGMGEGGDELDKVDDGRGDRKVGPGTRLQPVVRQSSVVRQSRGKLPGIDQ